jgi:hypothetical protein
MKWMMGVFLLTFFLLTLPVPSKSISFQDNPWDRNVRRQLRVKASTMADYDILASHEVVIDTLTQGYRKDVTYELEAGVRYIFVGACDQDCTNLDLELYDDNGRLIASDAQSGAEPSLVITVRRTTTFHLRVIMEACSANPCWWGTGAYKPAQD